MVSKAICRDVGAIYCQGFRSSPTGPICSYNNTFYLCASRKGGAQHSGEAEASTGSQSDDVY